MKVPPLKHLASTPVSFAPYWIAAAITAIVSIVYAKAFAYAESTSFSLLGDHLDRAFITIPLVMMVSTAMAEFFSRTAAGSGIPQLIAGLRISETGSRFIDEIFGLPMLVAKFVGSCLCVLGGGVTGREGPNLQMSAAIFNQVHKYWPKAKAKIELQSMILAGGAAGLAAAFNTPLGGIVFAIEELAKVHISRVRTAIFHAVVIAGLCVQAILGNYLYIGKSTFAVSGATEIAELAISALVIGALGATFGLWSHRTLVWRSKLPLSRRLVVTFALSLVLALLVWTSGTGAIGSGRDVIRTLLTNFDSPLGLDYFLGFVRVAANYLTYSAGVIGGIFAPALSSGAGFGASMGHLVGTQNGQLWVLVGMVAFLTGVTRTPFTSTILVLEMTDSHEVIVVLMLASIMAQGAAKLIDPVSFYEHASERFVKWAEEAKS